MKAEGSWTDASGEVRPITTNDILVVAPYNAQVRALRERLPEHRIGPVDKFQGQAAAVVVVSMTTSSAEDMPRGMGFLYSRHRLNVATSRARCVAIVVGSPALLDVVCRTPGQIAACQRAGGGRRTFVRQGFVSSREHALPAPPH